MARPKNLIERVATHHNLKEAWEDISRNAKPCSHGISEQTIRDYRASWKVNNTSLRKELLRGNYRFSPVRAVTIEKKGGKKRPLRISDVRDRVVRRAMTRVMETYLI